MEISTDEAVKSALERLGAEADAKRIRTTAFHEAGHAVVGVAMGLPVPTVVSIVPNGRVVWPEDLQIDPYVEICCALAGDYAQQQLVTGVHDLVGARTDYRRLTPALRRLSQNVNEQRSELSRAMMETWELVDSQREVVGNFAEALIESGELQGLVLEALLAPVDPDRT